jgi:hypothetical protein
MSTNLGTLARRWWGVGDGRVRGLRVGRHERGRRVERCTTCTGGPAGRRRWWAFWRDELCGACAGTGTATDVDNVVALRFWRSLL